MVKLVQRVSDLATAIAVKFNTITSRLPPAGGTAGQVLAKGSDNDYSYSWTSTAPVATKLATPRAISTTGDVTVTIPGFDGTGNVSATANLTTVNSAPGSYGSASAVPILTVDAKGRVTAASSAPIGSTSNTFYPVQSTRDGFTSSGVGGNSNANPGAYQFGYQEAGDWNFPYPDLVIGYHTGMKFGAVPGYGGMRFYDNHPSQNPNELFSIGNGDGNIRATNSLYLGGGVTTGGSATVTSGTGGFQNATYAVGQRNRIWSFGNADAFGLSYHQGSAGLFGSDSVGVHFGNTAAGSPSSLNITSSGAVYGYTAGTVDISARFSHTSAPAGWSGRIISSNSNLDRAAFIATYKDGTSPRAGIFAHNDALNDWRDLYINTVNGNTCGGVYMPPEIYINNTRQQFFTSPARPGATKLYRRDDESGFSVQTNHDGTYWFLRGYDASNNFHAECRVGRADSSGNSDTLGSYSPSVGVVGSSVVVRDGNGYGFFSYINSNTPTNENAAISQVITTNGDGYYRKSGANYFINSVLNTGAVTVGRGSVTYFRSNSDTGNSTSAPLEAYSDNGSGAIMSFHRAGQFAVNMGLDSDNVFRIGGWSAAANLFQLDMSGNQTLAGYLNLPNATAVVRDGYRGGTSTLALTGGAIWAAAAPVVISDATTITLDFSTFINGSITLGGNRTLANPVNLKVGQSGFITLIQDGSGSRTLAFGDQYWFAGGSVPTLTTAAGAIDRLYYTVTSSSTVDCSFVGNLQRTFDPDAMAYFAAHSVQASPSRKILINNLIAGLKADGIWALFDNFWLLASHDSQSSLVNAVRPSKSLLLYNYSGGPVFTVDRGWQQTATTGQSYYNQLYTPDVYQGTGLKRTTASNGAFGVWENTNYNNGGSGLMGDRSGNNYDYMYISNNTLSGNLGGGGTFQYTYPSMTTGMRSIARSGSDSARLYQNGTSVATGTAGGGFSGSTMAVLDYGSGGSYSGTPNRAAFAFSGGDGFTPAVMTALYNRINTYLSAIGAN